MSRFLFCFFVSVLKNSGKMFYLFLCFSIVKDSFGSLAVNLFLNSSDEVAVRGDVGGSDSVSTGPAPNRNERNVDENEAAFFRFRMEHSRLPFDEMLRAFNAQNEDATVNNSSVVAAGTSQGGNVESNVGNLNNQGENLSLLILV